MQDELRQKAVADQFINFVAAEVAAKFVLVGVVASDGQLFAVRRELPVSFKTTSCAALQGWPGWRT